MQNNAKTLAFAALAALGFAGSAQAALSLTSTLTPTVENFDGLPTTTPATSPFSATLGVAAPVPGTSFDAAKVANSNASAGNRLPLLVSNGSSSNSGIYSYGTDGSADRALGTLASTPYTPAFGVQIVNNTGSALTSISLSGFRELWRLSSANVNTVSAAYAVGNGTLTATNYLNPTNNAAFTAIPTLDLVGTPLGFNDASDGNAAANRAAVAGTVVANIPVGGSIFFRWVDVDEAGNDAGLALDDLTVTAVAVPEPTGVCLVGFAGLGTLRRRRA